MVSLQRNRKVTKTPASYGYDPPCLVTDRHLMLYSTVPEPVTLILGLTHEGSTLQLAHSCLKCQAFSLPLNVLGHLEHSSLASTGCLVSGKKTSGMEESLYSRLLISPLMSCDMGWQRGRRSWDSRTCIYILSNLGYQAGILKFTPASLPTKTVLGPSHQNLGTSYYVTSPLAQ